MSDEIGVIGCGRRSTEWYRRAIEEAMRSSPRSRASTVTVQDIPFDSINEALPSEPERAGELLMPYLIEMQASPVARYVVANITLHEAIDIALARASARPGKLLHIREVISTRRTSSIRSAMVIGSAYTMRSRYLRGLFPAGAVEWVEPRAADIERLDQIRRDVYAERFPPAEAAAEMHSIFAAYPDVHRFVIACTEHSQVLTHYTGDEVFDIAREQCRQLVLGGAEQIR